MEKIIIVCLILIIVILLYDRTIFKSPSHKTFDEKKTNPHLPDIMGKPKLQPIRKPSQVESIPEKPPIDPNDLEIEYDENETLYHPISKKEQDKEGTNVIDLEEEEEEWYQHHLSTVDPGFAQGVTFEELGMVSTFLQNDALKKGQEDEVISIVHKIQGTELFDLLENSIENVSTKIAQLLDNTLASEPINSSPTKQENIPLSDFDIEEFL